MDRSIDRYIDGDSEKEREREMNVYIRCVVSGVCGGAASYSCSCTTLREGHLAAAEGVIYIYIYIEREREMCVYIYIYMYTSLSLYIYIYIHTYQGTNQRLESSLCCQTSGKDSRRRNVCS